MALVTGASQGIGRACAIALAEAGATVALCARSREKLDEVAAEINGGIGRRAEAAGEIDDAAAICGGAASAGAQEPAVAGAAHTFALDLSSEESIKDCAKAVIAQLGKVDILVNNAGITRDILALRMKR